MTDSLNNKAVFGGSKYAEHYRKGRPTYPESLIEAILKYLKEKVTQTKPARYIKIFYFNIKIHHLLIYYKVFCKFTFHIQLNGPLVLGIDVGCGPGESTWILQPFFENVVGLDYCQSMVDYANKTNQFSNVTYK